MALKSPIPIRCRLRPGETQACISPRRTFEKYTIESIVPPANSTNDVGYPFQVSVVIKNDMMERLNDPTNDNVNQLVGRIITNAISGEGGIRTPGNLAATRALQARALVHYATSPETIRLYHPLRPNRWYNSRNCKIDHGNYRSMSSRTVEAPAIRDRMPRPRITGKNALLLTVAIALLAPPIINIESSVRVLQSTFGIPVDCSDTTSAMPFDAVVIFDGGPTYLNNGNGFPSTVTKRRIRAAAIKYVEWTRQGNQPASVVFLNGEAPETYGAYIEWFRKYVDRASGNTITVPDGAFTIESDINTSGNAEDLALLYRSGRFRRAALFTTGSHLPRAMILSCNRGIHASGFDAEEVIMDHDASERTVINQFLRSPANRRATTREFMKRLILPFDPYGRTLTWFKEQGQQNVRRSSQP